MIRTYEILVQYLRVVPRESSWFRYGHWTAGMEDDRVSVVPSVASRLEPRYC